MSVKHELKEKSLEKVTGGVASVGKKTRNVHCLNCGEDFEVPINFYGKTNCKHCNKPVFVEVSNVAKS